MELRYLGFDQSQSARAFRFDIIIKGTSTRQAVVTADLGLFLQYRVGIQEGPALSAAKLTADLEKSDEGTHVLTADDLRSYAEARAAAEAQRSEMRAAGGRRHHTQRSGYQEPRGGE